MSDKHEAVHNWFGLTYSSYLVMPRSILQSMPDKWQKKFIDLIEEIQDTLNVADCPDYKVHAVNAKGKFISDKYRDYERGRRRIGKRRGGGGE